MYPHLNRSSMFGPFQSTLEDANDSIRTPLKYADIYILATNEPLKPMDSIDMYFECHGSNSSLSSNEFYYFLGIERDNYIKNKAPLFVYRMSDESSWASEQIVNRDDHSFVIETVAESRQEKFKISFSTSLEKRLITKSLSAVNSILGSINMASDPNETNNVIIKLKDFKASQHEKASNVRWNSVPVKTEEPYWKNDFRVEKRYFAVQPFSFITASDISSMMTSDYMILLFSQMIREKVKMEDLEHISRRRSSLREGTLGFKCMHCHGIERGLYFPSTLKALQGTPTLLHKHFMTCVQCPQILKDTLVRSKKYHKEQISRINSQTAFFTNIFNRVRDASFNGGSISDREYLHKYISKLCETYSKDIEIAESVPSVVSFSMDSPRQVFGTPCTPNEHDWFAITPFLGENNSCAIQWDSECIMQLQQLVEGDKDYEEMLDLLLHDS